MSKTEIETHIASVVGFLVSYTKCKTEKAKMKMLTSWSDETIEGIHDYLFYRYAMFLADNARINSNLKMDTCGCHLLMVSSHHDDLAELCETHKMLAIIEDEQEKRNPSYNCNCDCGNEITATQEEIESDAVTSCGQCEVMIQ